MLRNTTFNESSLEAHLSKYRKLMPSLSLIFGIVRESGKITENFAVNDSDVEQAISWVEYLERHALKIYSAKSNNGVESIKTFLLRMLSGDIVTDKKLREIQRNGWKNLSTAEQINYVLDFFEEKGWIKVSLVQTSARPTRIIEINPNITKKLIQKELNYA